MCFSKAMVFCFFSIQPFVFAGMYVFKFLKKNGED